MSENEFFRTPKKLIITSIMLLFTSAVIFPGKVNMAQILSSFHYRSIGPTRQGGRISDFAVPRQQPYTFYVAAGSGGVWKTTDNGTTFHPIFDEQGVISIGDIAVAPSDPEVIWVGTGEASLRNCTYYGDGVYKSVDGGRTWINTGLKESHHIGRIVIHPQNPDIVYVAAQGHLYTPNPERGLYKTTDGGKTWQKVLEVVVDGRHIGVTDVCLNPLNPEIVYAAAYDRQRFPWSFRTAGPGSGIYKSSDGGKTWKKMVKGLPQGLLGRIGLAIYPRRPEIIYATIDNANSPGVPYKQRFQELFAGLPPAKPTIGHEIYRSDDGGETWRKVSPEGKSIGNRSNYYGQIRVDPNDENHVYVLSTRVDESRDGGRTWRRAFRYGGDNHALWIDPANSNHLLLGYDYGMAISYDGGQNWYHPDNLPLAQLYAIGIDMDYPYNVYGGMQDFGTWKGPSTKKGRFPIRFEDWEHMLGGDGFYCQCDPTDSRWLYAEAQFGELVRIDQKTGLREEIAYRGEEKLRFNWCAPFLISPHDPQVLYHGANVVLRSSNRGESWQIISPDLTSNDPAKLKGVGAVQFCTITTLDESPLQEGLIWVGTDDGRLWLTRDRGENWTRLDKNIPQYPGYWVTRVVASYHHLGTAYVTLTGFYGDDFRPLVYKTTDFGQTWCKITQGLPDEGSANVIREDRKNPYLLFLGTDKGVYVSLNGGEKWEEMSNNLPTVPVHDLVIHPRENDLVVGTHGRGFYLTDISPLQELTPEVFQQEVHLFDVEPKVQWVMPHQKAVAAQNYSGENEIHGVVINYYLKEAKSEKVKILIYDGTRTINELNGPSQAGLNRVVWWMTRREKRSPAEIIEWEKEQEMLRQEEEFFDYYDTVEYYGPPSEEVDRWGRSLRTRVHHPPGLTQRDYKYFRVKPGEYRVVLKVGSRQVAKKSLILPDYWYDD